MTGIFTASRDFFTHMRCSFGPACCSFGKMVAISAYSSLPGVQVLLQLHALELDLLLEEALQDEGARARLLDPLDAVHVRREVARTGDDRVVESQCP